MHFITARIFYRGFCYSRNNKRVNVLRNMEWRKTLQEKMAGKHRGGAHRRNGGKTL